MAKNELKKEIKGHNINLRIKLNKEGKVWVAYCKELGVSTFGQSFEETKRRIEEAIEVYLGTLEDAGKLEEIIRKIKNEKTNRQL